MTIVNSSGVGLAFTPPDVATEQLEPAPSPDAPRAKLSMSDSSGASNRLW